MKYRPRNIKDHNGQDDLVWTVKRKHHGESKIFISIDADDIERKGYRIHAYCRGGKLELGVSNEKHYISDADAKSKMLPVSGIAEQSWTKDVEIIRSEAACKYGYDPWKEPWRFAKMIIGKPILAYSLTVFGDYYIIEFFFGQLDLQIEGVPKYKNKSRKAVVLSSELRYKSRALMERKKGRNYNAN